jgi:hypothetical protein
LFVFLSLFFWPLCCLTFFDLRLLIITLWPSLIYDFWLLPSDLLWFTTSDYYPLTFFDLRLLIITL